MTIRDIASEEYSKHAHKMLESTFEELWEAVEAQSKASVNRPKLGELTETELRRWWRATVLQANARAFQVHARRLTERAQTELKMAYFDAAESRGLPDSKPLLFDPVTGTLLEAPPPVPPRAPNR